MNHLTNDWMSIFIERESIIENIHDIYEQVVTGQGPKFLTLVGESGTGKTRIVREFYQLIRSRHDTENYWPDNFPGNYLTPQLSPDFKNHRQPESTEKPPFIWWAVRFTSDEIRNAPLPGISALPNTSGEILAVLAVLIGEQGLIKLGVPAVDSMIEALNEWFPTLIDIGSSLPIAKAKTLFAAVKAISALATYQKNSNAAKYKNSSTEENRLDIIVKLMSEFFSGNPQCRARNIPIVLALDDIHWIDKSSSNQIFKIIARATSEKWNLLIISTVWRSPWNHASANPHTALGSLRSALNQMMSPIHGNIERHIEPIKAVDQYIKKGLPGLTRSQLKYIISKNGSDLYSTSKLIDFLRRKPYFFEGKSISNSLTEKGVASIENNADRSSQGLDDFHNVDIRWRPLLTLASVLGPRLPIGFSIDIVNNSKSLFGLEINIAIPSPKELNYLALELQTGTLTIVDTITKNIIAEEFFATNEMIEGVVGAGIEKFHSWVYSIDTTSQDEHIHAAILECAGRLISLAKKYNIELNRYDFSIELIYRVIENIIGTRDKKDSINASCDVAADIKIYDTMLSSLPIYWRTKWLQRTSNSREWMTRGAASLIKNNLIANEIVKDALQSLKSKPDCHDSAQSIARSSRVIRTLAMKLSNYFLLTDRVNSVTSINEEPSPSSSIIDNSIRYLTHCTQELGALSSAPSAIARSSMLLDIAVLSEYDDSDIIEEISRSLCSIEYWGSTGERNLALLLSSDIFNTVVYGWNQAHHLKRYSSLIKDKIFTSINIESPKQMRCIQLIAAQSLILDPHSLNTEEKDILISRKDSLLEYIRRGYSGFAIDLPAELFGELIDFNINSCQNREDPIAIGWKTAKSLIIELTNACPAFDQSAATKYFYFIAKSLAKHAMISDGIASFDYFISNINTINGGSIVDATLVARCAWTDVCMHNVESYSKFHSAVNVDFLTSAINSTTPVPDRVLKLLESRHSLEDLLDHLEDGIPKNDPDSIMLKTTSNASLMFFCFYPGPGLEDWVEASSRTINYSKIYSFGLQNKSNSKYKDLYLLWEEFEGHVISCSDEWLYTKAKIEDIVNQN